MSGLRHDEVVAAGEILVISLPNIHQTNEIAQLVLCAPGARSLVDQIGAIVKQVKDQTPREDKENGLSFSVRALRSALDWIWDNPDTMLAMISESVLPILSERATLVAVVALDTSQNRARLAATPEWVAAWGDPKKLEPLPGQESIQPTLRARYSPAVRAWALEAIGGQEALALTMRAVTALMGGGVGKPSGMLSPDTQPPPSVPEAPKAETAPETTTST